MKDFLNISGLFQTIQQNPWSVVAEWLLIGLVVYWVLRFPRRTRGRRTLQGSAQMLSRTPCARMLQGIASILIVLYVIINLIAPAFHLDRLPYLYGQFLQFASI